MRPMSRAASALLGVVLFGSACSSDDGASTSDATEGSTTSADDTTGGGDANLGGEMLGCPPDAACQLLLVAQTLDDRVEVFSPGDPAGSVYRGAVDVDLKPNVCDGCEPGDNGDERLDEPFGLARAGGHLHVIAGHFPTRELGTLLSFPLSFFEGRAAGSGVDVAEYYDGAFSGAIEVPLGELEPIYLSVRGNKLLVGTFANDLFATEDTWTTPGKLLVLDAEDPAAGIGEVDLAGLTGGACNAAGEVVELGPDRLGVACDGNEAVALLDVGDLDALSPVEAAATITGSLCDIPGSTSNRRVRHLAADGAGGFIVAEGPTPLDLLGGAQLWRFSGECQMLGLTVLASDGDWQLGNVVALPGASGAWVFVAGAATPTGHRGVWVARESGGAELEICGPIAGFESHLVDPAGAPLEPLTVAVTADGSHLAVGAGPFQTAADAPGFGKVLWATLSGMDDPCTMTASVVDLTDGSMGAPAVDAADPSTWRRAPSVVQIVELGG